MSKLDGAMFDNVPGRGLCLAPFLDASLFPKDGGYLGGRMCTPVGPTTICCLPCPATDWIYPQNFKVWYLVAQILALIGIILCAFLGITWIFVPSDKSRRHYMNVCLVIGILLLMLAFVIPLGAHPKQCYNDITPNDLTTDLSCGFSGACIILGGLVTAIWISFRALSMHLQICWDVVPGKKIFWFTLIGGFGFSVLFFVLSIVLTGVSYRFGDTCHINAHNSLSYFWAPLLVVAAFAGLTQCATLIYCLKVYLATAWNHDATNSHLGSATGAQSQGSTRRRSKRAVYQRVTKVLWLQWRSMAVIMFLLVDIIFFSIVWIRLDTSINSLNSGHIDDILPFLTCISMNPGKQRSDCFELGQKAFVSHQISIAILILLALAGIQTGILNIRSSMFVGWKELFASKFRRNDDFTELDVKRFSSSREAFQMEASSPNGFNTHNKKFSASDTLTSEKDSPNLSGNTFDRQYRQPKGSFSVPRPTSSHRNHPPSWDPNDTFAPSTEPIKSAPRQWRDDHV